MEGIVYTALPESICAALRGAADGFVQWEDDVANNQIKLRVLPRPISVSRSDATQYVLAWRKSGLWALKGLEA